MFTPAVVTVLARLMRVPMWMDHVTVVVMQVTLEVFAMTVYSNATNLALGRENSIALRLA